MSSPRRNIASRYLESLGENSLEPVRPLQPSSRFNTLSPSKGSSPTKKSPAKQDNLDTLASELNSTATPSKTQLLRSKFDSSATVSSFKSFDEAVSRSSTSSLSTPTKTSSTKTTIHGSPSKTSLSPSKSVTENTAIEPPTFSTKKETQAYEYLCRIAAAKAWIEECINEEIPAPVQLIEHIRNGIVLAKLTKVFKPQLVKNICLSERLQYKHTENINFFFKFLDFVGMPDLFRFELTDLYEKKNVPKVWFCLHALSFILSSEKRAPRMKNLVGTLIFSQTDITASQRSLQGQIFPNFATIGGDEASDTEESIIEESEPEPEPEPVEEEPVYEPIEMPSVVDEPVIIASPIHADEVIEVEPDVSQPIQIEPIPRADYQFPDANIYLENIIKIQSLSRGALLRYKFFIDRVMLRSFSDEIDQLKAIYLGSQKRAEIHSLRSRIMVHEESISKLQSLIRKIRIKKDLDNFLNGSRNNKSSIVDTQSLIRGHIARQKVKAIEWSLSLYETHIMKLQSVVRSRAIYKLVSKGILVKQSHESSIIQVQSIARRFLFDNRQKYSDEKFESAKSAIISLQCMCRGRLTRDSFQDSRERLARYKLEVNELQSISRGALTRSRLFNEILLTLYFQESTWNQFFSKVRGNLFRERVTRLKTKIRVQDDSIVKVQSLIRGVLTRFRMESSLDDLYDNIHPLIDIQSIARGALLRLEQQTVIDHYLSNIDKVIKVQSFLRTSGFRAAYRSLITMKNPPLSAIRRFANLIAQNDLDYSEEIRLQNLKNSILEKSKKNEDLELQIDNIDIKLGLLAKNKISVEEFIKHKNKHVKAKSASAAKLSDKLESLSKPTKTRIELFQKFFYLLQTRPIYFIKLFELSGKSDNLIKELESAVTKVYKIISPSPQTHSREEFFFVRLLMDLMESDVKRTDSLTKQENSHWHGVLNNFNNQTYQRQYLKSIFGKSVISIADYDDLDFESDPCVIYQNCIEKEIKRTGDSTSRPESLPAEKAIKDPEVSKKFVENLLSLREYSNSIIGTIKNNVTRVPLHIRMVAKSAFDLSNKHFPEKTEKHHLSVVGVIFIKYYLSPILTSPENFGILSKEASNNSHNKRARSNMHSLAKVLLQVFSMRPFGDTFLQPLNDYVNSSVDDVLAIIRQLISVQDLETEYQMSPYDDIVSRERPSLTMRISEMITIVKLFTEELEVDSVGDDDSIVRCLTKIAQLPETAHDLFKLSDLGEVSLNLNPVTEEESLAESKVKNSFMQAKRSILYVIKVQKGSDLLELLISKITPEDELKFKQIVESEEAEIQVQGKDKNRRPYSESSLGDLSKTTFHVLKKSTLEVIIQLERMGKLTRKDSFQELLNQIAVDIKNQHEHRVSRKRQLATASDINDKLMEKERFLTKQLNDFNKYIDNMLSQLQSTPKDRKILNLIPVFTKQYFYHRELRRAGRLPQFGSYKYSVKKLMEQRVLVELKGNLNSQYSRSSKLDFVVNCNEAGKFTLEAATGSVSVTGAFAKLTIDDLLHLQHENKAHMEIFNGMAILDTANFISLIFRKFYDIKT